METRVPPELEYLARARVEDSQAQILNTLRSIEAGNPLAAEPDAERLLERLQTKASLSREEAEAIVMGIRAMNYLPADKRREMSQGAEAIYGRTIDFVGVSFLERGVRASRSVARVAFRDGRPQGSGFMVGERLFLTNKHVVESASKAGQFVVEFDYELDPADNLRGSTRFALDAGGFYLSDDINNLDYALIAVGDRLSGPHTLDDYAWCVLSDAKDKHALGEVANIVQHPDGRYKEVVLRENSLVARLDFVLHYVADTEPGSSGSPVFNNEWKVIALHHWGGPWRQKSDDKGRPLPREVNEGIRISSIVHDLRAKLDVLPAARRAMLERVLAGTAPTGETASDQPGTPGAPRFSPDGSVSWTIPLEVSVRLPLLSRSEIDSPPGRTVRIPDHDEPEEQGYEALKPDPDYSDREGYDESFLEGFTVPLPKLSPSQKKVAARNQKAAPDDDPFELPYHHFSLVMNKKRRLAFFTACNVDGLKAKHVDRKTGKVSDLKPGDPRIEALTMGEGAEASDQWYNDDRLDPDEYAGKDIYEKQVVPGFPQPSSHGRIQRMFQRGHLVRRMDPAWGTASQARKADADTFHWTNCSPQVGFFNTGDSLWRAVENYVLRNAVAEDQRVCVFTGPVFRSNDRKFRGIGVPKKFWKLMVWSEADELRSLALVADQSKVIEVWPEAFSEGEAFGDASELEKVKTFLSTVVAVETATGLDFGGDVRSADIRATEGQQEISHATGIPLAPRRRVKKK